MVYNGSNKHDVLLVEDDKTIGECTSSALQCFEFNVTHVSDGQQCFQAMQKSKPELVLLDLELPGLSGHDICRGLRELHFQKLPIIALSACDDDESIVKVLNAGADDFVSKADSISVLLAHMRAAIKRSERFTKTAEPTQIISWGPIKIDRASWKTTVNGLEASLTPTEQKLLEIFISSPGVVFTRSQLIDQLHGVGHVLTPRTIDVHINALRNQLGTLRDTVETVRGVGYRFAESPKTSTENR